MRAPILLLALIFCFKGWSQENAQANPPQIFIKAPIGKSVHFEGGQIKLIEVLEDSRCPKGVECVWAGQAKVQVMMVIDGASQTQELILNGVQQHTLFKNKEYFLKVMALSPYPTTEKIEKAQYHLLLLKESIE